MAKPAMPIYWPEACSTLASEDPVLCSLIERYPGFPVSRGDPFQTLVRSIVGQQISTKAADAVWLRLTEAASINPVQLLNVEPAALRNCGLSQRKVEYVKDLARNFAEVKIDTSRWPACSDEEIIRELVSVRGIGVWTAEMLLIFTLLRPDVFPAADLGLQKAISLHYAGGKKLTQAELREVGEQWRPWRTVATWYLWRSRDPVAIEY